jgi:hypothetical protein
MIGQRCGRKAALRGPRGDRGPRRSGSSAGQQAQALAAPRARITFERNADHPAASRSDVGVLYFARIRQPARFALRGAHLVASSSTTPTTSNTTPATYPVLRGSPRFGPRTYVTTRAMTPMTKRMMPSVMLASSFPSTSSDARTIPPSVENALAWLSSLRMTRERALMIRQEKRNAPDRSTCPRSEAFYEGLPRIPQAVQL